MLLTPNQFLLTHSWTQIFLISTKQIKLSVKFNPQVLSQSSSVVETAENDPKKNKKTKKTTGYFVFKNIPLGV